METRDQTGYSLIVPDNPSRIISLVPSQTELLIDLGLADRLVGRTKFCVHPASKVEVIPIIGGTKNYRFDVIESLNPDLILGNKEENEKQGIERLRASYPVWLSDIQKVHDAMQMIETFGIFFGVEDQASYQNECIQERIDDFDEKKRLNSIYLIWKDPWMAAGKETFIDEMMRLSGFQNSVTKSRYPEVSLDEIRTMNPELVLLSSEPYPFKEHDVVELQRQLPGIRVIWVDGEMFSWYGSRLIRAMDYLQELYEELES